MDNKALTPPEHFPHVITGPFDQHAWASLAVMGCIEAFHAGLKIIYITPNTVSFVRGSGPAQALISSGWTFKIIKETAEI